MPDAKQPAASVPIVVMGVSGSGKSTVGKDVAHALGVDFVDGDTLHPSANKEKMAAGHPLNDEDRLPWLKAVGGVLAEADEVGRTVVVACSALKRSYRDLLRASAADAVFVQLDGSREVLAARLAPRKHEYMPAKLLDSQLATLEPLQPDEVGFVIDIDGSPADVSARAVDGLNHLRGARG